MRSSGDKSERRTIRARSVQAVLVVALNTLQAVCPGISSAGIEFAPVAPLAGAQAAADGLAADRDAEVETDGNGTWLAVWSQGPGGGLGITGFAPVFVRSVDDGITWSAPALLRPEAADDASPSAPGIATDGQGKWLVVWGTNLFEMQMTESFDNGQSWGTPRVLVSASYLHGGPSAGTDGSGTWVVTWQSLDSLGGTIDEEGDILFSRSVDDGATWSAPAPVNTDAAGDFHTDAGVRLATGGSGTWVAVWSSYAQAWYARSADNGATWSARTTFGHVGLGGPSSPDVATDGDGNWTAVWSVDGGFPQSGLDIWVSHSQDDGLTWTAESRLHPYMSNDRGDHEVPRIAAQGGGLWTAVWTSGDDLGGTKGRDTDTAVSTSRDNGTTWSAPAAVSTHSRRDGEDFDFDPGLASSPTGNTVVAWHSNSSLGGTIGTDFDILFATAHRDCAVIPRGDCRGTTLSRGSTLRVRDGNGGNDRMRWRWVSEMAVSDSDLGDPTASDSYALCLYEKVSGVSSLIGQWNAVAAGTCRDVPCWIKSPGSVEYTDSRTEIGSIKKLSLRSLSSGGSQIRLQAFGPTLAPPLLPLDVSTPVQLQLVNLGTGVCWSGVHDQAGTNDVATFKSISNP